MKRSKYLRILWKIQRCHVQGRLLPFFLSVNNALGAVGTVTVSRKGRGARSIVRGPHFHSQISCFKFNSVFIWEDFVGLVGLLESRAVAQRLYWVQAGKVVTSTPWHLYQSHLSYGQTANHCQSGCHSNWGCKVLVALEAWPLSHPHSLPLASLSLCPSRPDILQGMSGCSSYPDHLERSKPCPIFETASCLRWFC